MIKMNFDIGQSSDEPIHSMRFANSVLSMAVCFNGVENGGSHTTPR